MFKQLILSFSLIAAFSNISANESIEADLDGFSSQNIEQESSDLEGFSDENVEYDDLSGFQENDILVQTEETQEDQTKKASFSLSGDLAFKTSYGYMQHSVNGIDYFGFNQAQTSLYLQLDGKLSDNWKIRISGDTFYDAIYALHPNNDYNNDIQDTYETQLRLDDTYIQGRLTKNLDLKVGRQRVVWGKSDSIRVTDVINPLDNRLPGMTDIEDLRLSVGMAKFDYYIGSWNLSAMLIGESRIMLEAAPRGEFFPVDKIFPIAPDPFIDLDTPDSSLRDMQYAFAANGIFSGWDLSFYAADVLDQKWHIENAGTVNAVRKVSKIKMLGSALNIAIGSWLLKSEVAFFDGVKYNSTLDDKQRLDVLLGFDYMGISDTVLSLEVASKHIFDYETQMSQNVPMPDYLDQNEFQTAIRATRSFVNDSINATVLLNMFGSSWEYGGFARVWVEYDVMDAVVANVGLVDYIDGDKPFTKAISDNDRVFADITYSF